MKKDVFNIPNPVTIMGRSSSITNSFVNGIIPVIQPTEEQIRDALTVLGQNETDVRCVYCGDKNTEWDHLYPLIIGKKHTGYITEIANLVPSCGKCNQSKGNSYWKEWMTSNAKKSPKSRGIPDIDDRIRVIDNYDKQFTKQQINLENIAGKDLWSKYQKAYEAILFTMESAQTIMEKIKEKIISSNQQSQRANNQFEIKKGNKTSSVHKINIHKSVYNEDTISKSEAIQLLKDNGLEIFGNITFSSENTFSHKYWANPSVEYLKTDWWLIVNDISKKVITAFYIPAFTIKRHDIVVRTDKPELMDLQVNYNDESFIDSRSGIEFGKWLKKSISY